MDRDQLIGQRIKELRTMSFFLNLKLMCNSVALYIKTGDDFWYGLTLFDGILNIVKEDDEPSISFLSDINDEFAYPIDVIHDYQFDGRISDIKRYLWQGDEFECFGVYIEFENGSGFNIIEDDNCLSIVTGILEIDKSNYKLVSCFRYH